MRRNFSGALGTAAACRGQSSRLRLREPPPPLAAPGPTRKGKVVRRCGLGAVRLPSGLGDASSSAALSRSRPGSFALGRTLRCGYPSGENEPRQKGKAWFSSNSEINKRTSRTRDSRKEPALPEPPCPVPQPRSPPGAAPERGGERLPPKVGGRFRPDSFINSPSLPDSFMSAVIHCQVRGAIGPSVSRGEARTRMGLFISLRLRISKTSEQAQSLN